MIIAVLTTAIIFLCVYIHSLLPVATALCLAYALSTIACYHLLSGDSPSEFQRGWLVVILLLPVGGAVLYFISRPPRVQPLQNTPPPLCGYTQSQYFDDGATLLKKLTQLISSAQKSVLLEYYIIAKGRVWSGIYTALLSALDRGATVKIIYDGVGSATRAPKRDFKKLRARGAKIKTFHKPIPLPVYRLNVRDHRKIAVVDSVYFITGGVNIADEYAHITCPHAFWKDGGAMFKGSIALAYENIFLHTFNAIDCDQTIETSHEKYYIRSGENAVCAIADNPYRGADFEDEVARAVYSAKSRVHVFTPYLCLGEKLCDALSYAKKRGVDIKIILPSIPDKKLTYAISLTYGQKLLERGVEVYAYTPGFMHFKAMVCDNKVFLGSYNFDFRSMRLNYENGVVCNGMLAERAEVDFSECLALSQPLSPKKCGAITKLKRSVLCLFAPLV